MSNANVTDIRTFAVTQVRERLKELEQECLHCRQSLDEETIHDLRVAIRRFGEGLRLFQRLFPSPGLQQVRRELRGTMKLAGRVRNTDITRRSFAMADVAIGPEVDLALRNARATAEAGLAAALAVAQHTHFADRWRAALGIEATH